jgi:hypothetical protein
MLSSRLICSLRLARLRPLASAAEHLSALRTRCEVVRPFRYQLLTALGIGLLVAVAVWYAGPWFAAFVGGIGGFVTALAVQAGLWLRKVLAIGAEPAAWGGDRYCFRGRRF